jgi:hypothetical protein
VWGGRRLLWVTVRLHPVLARVVLAQQPAEMVNKVAAERLALSSLRNTVNASFFSVKTPR